MTRHKTITLALALCVGAGALTGCRGQTSTEAPVVPIRNMYNQPRYDSQERSEFFPDGRTMRPAHRRSVGMVFQDGRLFDHLSVQGNLDYASRRANKDGPNIARDAVVREAMEELASVEQLCPQLRQADYSLSSELM